MYIIFNINEYKIQITLIVDFKSFIIIIESFFKERGV